MREEVIASIINFITSDLGYPVELDEKSSLANDAGLDSLDAIDLMGYVERTYDVEVTDGELSILKEPIGSIADFICKKLEK